MSGTKELPIIQKTYDLILWSVPLLNKLPRNYKFVLGDRIQMALYDFLEGLIRARYAREKGPILEALNVDLDIVRYQLRLCFDLALIDLRRYEYISKEVNEIGKNLGGWIRSQRRAQ
jgi:hypothetical protein